MSVYVADYRVLVAKKACLQLWHVANTKEKHELEDHASCWTRCIRVARNVRHPMISAITEVFQGITDSPVSETHTRAPVCARIVPTGTRPGTLWTDSTVASSRTYMEQRILPTFGTVGQRIMRQLVNLLLVYADRSEMVFQLPRTGSPDRQHWIEL